MGEVEGDEGWTLGALYLWDAWLRRAEGGREVDDRAWVGGANMLAGTRLSRSSGAGCCAESGARGVAEAEEGRAP